MRKLCRARTFAAKRYCRFQIMAESRQQRSSAVANGRTTACCSAADAVLTQYVEARPRPRRPVAHITVQPVPLRMPLHERLRVERPPARMSPARAERHRARHFAVGHFAVVGAPWIERPVIGAAEARIVQ